LAMSTLDKTLQD